MPTSVRVFQSTDTGAPALSGTAGTLIALLDACLVNGYGTVTIDTLVVASNVATVTDSSGHGFTAIGTVGPVIRIAGATPAGLNGDWRITYVSATVFTFATAGITDQTASGTITATRAPLGFSKAFTGTNLAAYRPDDIAGTRMYLRVDDTGTVSGVVKGYEAMTDINTGTGLFPAAARYAIKSSTANATARPWKLIGDGKIFYFIPNSDSANVWDSLVFGDINSYKSGDAYHCWLLACTQATYASDRLYQLNGTVTGSDLARAYTQVGATITAGRYSQFISQYMGGVGSPYPNPVDNGFHAWPVEVWEATTQSRGMAPGLWNPIHNVANLVAGTVIADILQLSGRSLLLCRVNSASYMASFDISGPWR